MFTFQPISFMKNVLIESDWNLKMLVRRTQDEIDLVLIESDWNLKPVMQQIGTAVQEY